MHIKCLSNKPQRTGHAPVLHLKGDQIMLNKYDMTLSVNGITGTLQFIGFSITEVIGTLPANAKIVRIKVTPKRNFTFL